ncbi:glycosyltransferase family 39 protein [Terasakiella sp. A23]|uniref:ArnT family glycosyltransferase n=1 Tax=Terasakiella sp. FCG-A23 TaxID=3080561 RepID=UPI0029550131|nr:glycosyltransferase family 39 protein [Terasakiella sp. A23]MDV7340436.1 glycosyltransferase family 39 protein [Terasakiella sp. A23]
MQKNWSPLTFTLFWLILVIVAVVTRPALPVDETRYLAVAWEMWMRGDFIVPHLNGETYSHKPPLLFWIMNLGWAVFGVNDWWPPLVAPLFGLGCLFLTRSMAQKLWPDEPLIADLSPLILLGAAFWTVFTTVTMFDMLVAACTLWALLGLLISWRDGGSKGWWYLALAIGLGVLAKGPVILLQVLPIALLAPVWDRDGLIKQHYGGWKTWYLRILLAVLGGAVIGLAWAIPAGIYGGEEYRNAIFWGQTAGRVVKSFAHARPWWWYLAVIGPLLLPWMIWPTMWRAAFMRGRALWSEAQARFCILWFVPIFVAFSLISGKQLHYLLPIFPACAFLISRWIVKEDVSDSRIARILPAGLFVVLGTLLIALPYLPIKKLPDWALALPTYWMALPVLAALFVIVRPIGALKNTILGLVAMMSLFVVALHLVIAPYLANDFDLNEMSRQIKSYQDKGYDVAFVGKYHGTFQYLGRLEKPIAELGSNRTGIGVEDWVKDHPKSMVITLWKQDPPATPAVAYVQNFRSNNFIIFDSSKLEGDLKLLQRRGKKKK